MGKTTGKQRWHRFGLGIAAPVLGLLCSACAWLMPASEVPPPWEAAGLPVPAVADAAAMPMATGELAPPPVLRRLPERLPPLQPPPSETASQDVSPRRPAIYLASDPLGSLPDWPEAPAEAVAPSSAAPASAPAPSPPTSPPAVRLSQSQSLPVVAAPSAASPAAATTPAWRQAVIPEGSNRTPVGHMPPPAAMPGFVIGAGDTVDITVLGRPELSATGNVSGDGLVTTALIGAVPVLGLTPQQAAQRIAQAYKDGQYLVDPQVTVTLRDYQSQQLSVLGEVKSPGRFPMRTRLSILDALALAGGINDGGAQLAYILRPEDSVVTRYEIDLDALLQAGAGQQYFELLAGDTVVVPKAELFYIYGEVKSPNAYKLKPGLTVIQALSLAGGLTDKGSDRRIDIRRRDQQGGLHTEAATLSDALLPDDVIYVRERLF